MRFLTLYLATLSAARSVYSLAIPILPPQQTLHLNQNGRFHLSIFSDLHYGEAEDLSWGPIQDTSTTRVINNILDVSNPDFVVLNGDLITGENTHFHNSTRYVDVIVKPMVERRLGWASTYGNHDSDFNLSRAGILAAETKYRYCHTKSMVKAPDAGTTNYYLPVYGDNDSIPEFLLWFFDSRGGNMFQQASLHGMSVPQPDWVGQSVVDWFVETRDELVKQFGRAVPSVAFVHIPVNAMRAFQATGVDKFHEPGINDDDPLAQQGSASGQGDVPGTTFSYNGQDLPFMKALVETVGLRAIFSGHDHGDDWCFKWDTLLPGMNLMGSGIDMCFGRHTGYGGYGSWTRGGRQVVLDKNKEEIETWITLEDGSVSGKVTLNRTYGRDSYPPVKDTEDY